MVDASLERVIADTDRIGSAAMSKSAVQILNSSAALPLSCTRVSNENTLSPKRIVAKVSRLFAKAFATWWNQESEPMEGTGTVGLNDAGDKEC